ncbi:MAG: hypothetical protein ACJ754_08335, partial [Pyrinomonadaceae bacterium]
LRRPEPSALKRVRRATLLQFFHAHHSVRRETLEQRVGAIKAALPLTTDRAVLRSSGVMARALSFKWVRIIFRCWQQRVADDEVQYLESLRRKRSPLLSYAAQHAA